MASRPPGALLALLLFAMGLLLSICAVRLAVAGLPLRVLFMTACLGLVTLIAPQQLVHGAYTVRKAILVITLFALLGAVVSSVNGTSPVIIVQQIIEIHVQGIIGLILAAALVSLVGPRPVVIAFVASWGLSALFALGQALGLNFAWMARAIIGALMHDPPVTQIAYHTRYRALGLSFSPVHLATQACLAFAAIFAYRLYVTAGEAMRRIDWPIVAALAAVAVVCVASGNRSPLLGCVVFGAFYAWKVAPRVFTLAIPLVLLMAIAAVPIMSALENANVRVASTDDGSAEGRATQRYYGMRLFADRPLGYGLAFESTEHWAPYANEVIYMSNPMTIRNFALHNYFLMMLNKYGVMMLALLLLFVPRTRSEAYCWAGFVPYGVHIFFHNDGPLQGDFFIWYLLPLFMLANAAMTVHRPETGRARPWSRTYRARQRAREAGHA